MRLVLHVVQIGPHLGVVWRSGGIEDADDRPALRAGFENAAHRHGGEAVARPRRDDRLRGAGLKHPPFDETHVVAANPEGNRVDPAHDDVGPLAVALRYVDQDDELRRNERLAVVPAGETVEGPNRLVLVTADVALHVRLRTDTQHDDVEGGHGRRQRLLHSFGQRHDQQEDGDDESDAEDRHPGRYLAHDQIAQVVLERDPHQATCRNPSTIEIRAERMAGTNPARTPMATEALNAVRRVAPEILML